MVLCSIGRFQLAHPPCPRVLSLRGSRQTVVAWTFIFITKPLSTLASYSCPTFNCGKIN